MLGHIGSKGLKGIGRMELLEITHEEYGKITESKGVFFCKEHFLELNRDKVEKVRYFLGRDKKNRLAFAVGETENEWKAPYSAPFAMVVELQKITPIEYYWEFIALLNEAAVKAGICKITILLPPDIYGAGNNSKIINALLGSNYIVEYEEVNYALNLKEIKLDLYKDMLQSNARRNLKISLNSNLLLVKCTNLEEKKAAYEVIQKNHEEKGYPLRMSWKQVEETLDIVNHDVFLVKKNSEVLASAIIFHVKNNIVQIIYWGNMPGVEMYKPMNFLAYKLIEYYKEQNVAIIDIGPSSENGLPNYGLCSFKESIGCEVSSKYRLGIDLAKNGYCKLKGGGRQFLIIGDVSSYLIKNTDSPFHGIAKAMKCA